MVERRGPATRSSVQALVVGGPAGRRVTRAALEDAYRGCLAAEPRKQRSVGFVTDVSPIKRRSCSARSASETSDEGVGDLSLASPASLLPDIPPNLARLRHPLAKVPGCLVRNFGVQAWTLWHCQHDGQGRWGANQRPVATVATVEEFWQVQHLLIHLMAQVQQLLLPPSSLGLGSDFAVFRAGVAPDWEHSSNLCGGRLIVRRERRQLDESWLTLLFFLLGEYAGAADQVNGVVASVRSKGDRVAVWLADSRQLAAVVDVARMVRHELHLPPGAAIKFSVHKEEIAREEGGPKMPPILL